MKALYETFYRFNAAPSQVCVCVIEPDRIFVRDSNITTSAGGPISVLGTT